MNLISLDLCRFKMYAIQNLWLVLRASTDIGKSDQMTINIV